MVESKYGKYICTELKKNIELPGYRAFERGHLGHGEVEGKRRHMEHVIWMDSEVIPDAFYSECVWFWPESMTGVPMRAMFPEQACGNWSPAQ